MEFQAVFQFEAADAEAAHGMVSTWTVTPGTMLVGINSVAEVILSSGALIESGNVADHIPPYGYQEPFPQPEVPETAAVMTVNPPVADIGQQISFDGSASTGDIAEYHWDFGDGQTDTGAIVLHHYDEAGSYNAELTAVAADGEAFTTTGAVVVA